MPYADIVSYFLTVIAIALAPGPAALLIMVRSAQKDISGAIGFGFGYSLGGVIIITAVCFGLEAWFSTVPEIFEYGKYVMLAYLIWLAYRILHGRFDMSATKTIQHGQIFKSISAGTLTCFISPYMMILFPLLLSSLLDVPKIELPEFLVLSLTTFMGLAAGSVIIIIFAAQISRLAKSERSMRLLNRSLAGILVLGGSWMAFT